MDYARRWADPFGTAVQPRWCAMQQIMCHADSRNLPASEAMNC
jgi:hypothetical protein